MSAVDPDRTSRARTLARRAARIALPLALLAFWLGVLTAMRRYPSEFDWRYMPLSNLLSPRRDPAGHLWACAGVAACGLCSLGWSATSARSSRAVGIWLIRIGGLCAPLAALPPEWLRRVPESHQLFTLLTFVCWCLGLVHLMFQTIERLLLSRPGRPVRRRRVYAIGAAATAVLPILLAGIAQLYVFYALPQLGWVKLSWRAAGVPVWLSFAFWEWITCSVLSAYAMLLSVAWSGTPADRAIPGCSDRSSTPRRRSPSRSIRLARGHRAGCAEAECP